MQADSLLAEPPGEPKNTGVGSLPLLQGIFLTQESNQGLLHCRWIPCQLSYQGSPEWGPGLRFPLSSSPSSTNVFRASALPYGIFVKLGEAALTVPTAWLGHWLGACVPVLRYSLSHVHCAKDTQLPCNALVHSFIFIHVFAYSCTQQFL